VIADVGEGVQTANAKEDGDPMPPDLGRNRRCPAEAIEISGEVARRNVRGGKDEVESVVGRGSQVIGPFSA
jgi:hypothetical protein